jgi:hypothetical protein
MMDTSIVNADVRYSDFQAVFAFIDHDSINSADVTVNCRDDVKYYLSLYYDIYICTRYYS